MVRGGDGERAARAKLFEQRDGESRAFLGSCAGAHFVHENQRTVRGDIQHGFQIDDVRGKCGKVGGDGLFVADIGEHVIEDGQLGAFCGDRNTGLRRKRGEADGFQRDGLAAGVGSADDHYGFVATECERQGNGLAPERTQLGFEHGIARGIQAQEIALLKRGHHAINFTRESRAGENGIEMGDLRGRRPERGSFGAEPLGKFRKDPRNFDELFFGKLDQPIVQIDGFKWLDKNGLTGGARAVDHAGYAAPFGCAHGDHEAVVAQRDIIFAGGFAASAQNAFERAANFIAAVRDAGTDAAELRRSVVADFAVGKNRAADGRREVAKIGQSGGVRRKLRMFGGVFFKSLRTEFTSSKSEVASRSSAMERTDAGTARRVSQASGSASEPKPSSEPGRKYPTASLINVNSAPSAATSCCGASAATARRPGAQVV